VKEPKEQDEKDKVEEAREDKLKKKGIGIRERERERGGFKQSPSAKLSMEKRGVQIRGHEQKRQDTRIGREERKKKERDGETHVCWQGSRALL
jgi:hypothetical protein